MPLVIEALSAADLARDEAWWAIYAEAFPASVREPREAIVRSVEDSVGIAIRSRRGAATVGLATAHLLEAIPAVFLVYVATAPHERRRGGGRALIEEAWQLGAAGLRARHLDPAGLIWEVEDPDADVAEAQRAGRQQRVRFFRQLGGELLARPYLQPPVDGVAAVPMRLMYRPAPGSPPPSGPVIEALVRAIYFEKYGGVNGIPVSVLSDLLGSNDSPRSMSVV